MATRPGGLIEEALTHSVIGAFFEVYNTLGYGFLEHVYALALEYELRARGHAVGREVTVSIHYKGTRLTGQRLDMIVDEKLILEIKSTAEVPACAPRQLLNYLRATDLEVGLLLHFGPEPKFYRLFAAKWPNHPMTDPPPSAPIRQIRPTKLDQAHHARRRHRCAWQVWSSSGERIERIVADCVGSGIGVARAEGCTCSTQRNARTTR